MRGKRFFSYLVICISILALGACGFHLRGAMVLPTAMARTQLQGVEPHSELGNDLREMLTDAGAVVVAPDQPANAVLEVSGERLDRRVSSVDTVTGKATQYELRYQLSGLLRDPKGASLAPVQNVMVTRLLNIGGANALGASSEEEQLRREMRREAVRQLMRQLRTALQHPTAP